MSFRESLTSPPIVGSTSSSWGSGREPPSSETGRKLARSTSLHGNGPASPFSHSTSDSDSFGTSPPLGVSSVTAARLSRRTPPPYFGSPSVSNGLTSTVYAPPSRL